MDRFFPDQDFVTKAYAKGLPSLLACKVVADLETPVSAYLKACDGRPFAFLLESVSGNEVRGRYSILGLDPDLVWKVEGQQASTNRKPLQDGQAFSPESLPPLASLNALLAESQIAPQEDFPPMAAGLFGYLGYDMVRLMEPKLGAPNPDVYGTADALLIRPQILIVFDAVKDELIVITPIRPKAGTAADVAYRRAQARLDEICHLLDQPIERQHGAEFDFGVEADPVSNTPKPRFADMVARAKAYIEAGDIFQVVLSQRFSLPFPLPAFSLYRALRRINPSPFLYFLQLGDFSLVGSSPEILVRVREGEVTVRPIAGTRRRGRTPEDDLAMEAELLADPKELAEHLMLLDLGRNDVGRVAEIGSVKVTDKFFIERYSHVMHIVSHVVGKLRKGITPIEALVAGFPAGTVSGAPKVRAMEIIDELEAEKRGPYAGCVGYFSADGAMDSCIVLRTAIVKDGTMHIQAGAGIVADSDPKLEQKECENKAAGMVRAAYEAVRFAALGKRGQ